MSTSHGESDPSMKEARDADMERVELGPYFKEKKDQKLPWVKAGPLLKVVTSSNPTPPFLTKTIALNSDEKATLSSLVIWIMSKGRGFE